jgi:hypothetical protein
MRQQIELLARHARGSLLTIGSLSAIFEFTTDPVLSPFLPHGDAKTGLGCPERAPAVLCVPDAETGPLRATAAKKLLPEPFVLSDAALTARVRIQPG